MVVVGVVVDSGSGANVSGSGVVISASGVEVSGSGSGVLGVWLEQPGNDKQ